VQSRITLAAFPPGIIFCFNSSSVSLGYEVAFGFRLTQDAVHLNHPLKTAQQGIL